MFKYRSTGSLQCRRIGTSVRRRSIYVTQKHCIDCTLRRELASTRRLEAFRHCRRPHVVSWSEDRVQARHLKARQAQPRATISTERASAAGTWVSSVAVITLLRSPRCYDKLSVRLPLLPLGGPTPCPGSNWRRPLRFHMNSEMLLRTGFSKEAQGHDAIVSLLQCIARGNCRHSPSLSARV